MSEYKNNQCLFIQRAMNVLQTEEIKIVNYDKQMDLWQVIAKVVDVHIESLVVTPNSVYNCSLSLPVLSLMQRLISVMPEGLWDVGRHGERAVNSTFTRLGDLLANKIGTASAGKKLNQFTEEELAEIESSFKSKFEEQVQSINLKLRIEGGLLQLFPWPESTRKKWVNTDKANKFSDQELECVLLILSEIFHDFEKNKWFAFEDINRIEKVTIIRDSGIFDDMFYAREVMKRYNEKIRLNNDVVIAHFLKRGIADGVNPSAFFDVAWYINSNKDLTETDPVLHYIQHGAGEGRSPHPRISGEVAMRYRYRGNLVSLLNLYSKFSNEGMAGEVPDDLFKLLSHFNAFY